MDYLKGERKEEEIRVYLCVVCVCAYERRGEGGTREEISFGHTQ
jgi:hypothetical protein